MPHLLSQDQVHHPRADGSQRAQASLRLLSRASISPKSTVRRRKIGTTTVVAPLETARTTSTAEGSQTTAPEAQLVEASRTQRSRETTQGSLAEVAVVGEAMPTMTNIMKDTQVLASQEATAVAATCLIADLVEVHLIHAARQSTGTITTTVKVHLLADLPAGRDAEATTRSMITTTAVTTLTRTGAEEATMMLTTMTSTTTMMINEMRTADMAASAMLTAIKSTDMMLDRGTGIGTGPGEVATAEDLLEAGAVVRTARTEEEEAERESQTNIKKSPVDIKNISQKNTNQKSIEAEAAMLVGQAEAGQILVGVEDPQEEGPLLTSTKMMGATRTRIHSTARQTTTTAMVSGATATGTSTRLTLIMMTTVVSASLSLTVGGRAMAAGTKEMLLAGEVVAAEAEAVGTRRREHPEADLVEAILEVIMIQITHIRNIHKNMTRITKGLDQAPEEAAHEGGDAEEEDESQRG